MLSSLPSRLNILFVGINPHPGSLHKSVPFSNTKQFWRLAAQAGIIPLSPEQISDDTCLLHFYTTEFPRLGYAVVDMVDRPSRSARELAKHEEVAGRTRLDEIIHAHTPRIVCFVGKTPYRLYTGVHEVSYGWQSDPASTPCPLLYVMHTPSRGPAQVRVEEFKELMVFLGEQRDK